MLRTSLSFYVSTLAHGTRFSAVGGCRLHPDGRVRVATREKKLQRTSRAAPGSGVAPLAA